MHNFRKLKVWVKSRELVKDIYKLTNSFPKEELFGLTSQLKRSAISIPSNIAEGSGRGTSLQLIHFLNVANASSCELETQVYLAFDLGFINTEKLKDIINKINEIQKMILGFKNKLENNKSIV